MRTFSDAGSTPAASTTVTEYGDTLYSFAEENRRGLQRLGTGLPGCASQGQTEHEALENIRDAILEYLDVAEELAAEGDKREVVLQR